MTRSPLSVPITPMRFSLTHTTSSCLCKTLPRALGVGVGVEPEVPSSIAKFEAEAAAAASTSPPLSLSVSPSLSRPALVTRDSTHQRATRFAGPPRVPFPRNFPAHFPVSVLRYATHKLTSYTNKNNGTLPLPRGFIRRVENPSWVGGDGFTGCVTSSTTPISCLLQISIDGFSRPQAKRSQSRTEAPRAARGKRGQDPSDQVRGRVWAWPVVGAREQERRRRSPP